jgi:hypothetical protein
MPFLDQERNLTPWLLALVAVIAIGAVIALLVVYGGGGGSGGGY